MPRLTIGIAAITTVLAGLLAAAHVVGGLARPLPSVLLDSGECSQPCWQGVQPGRTTLDQAQRLLENNSELAARSSPSPFDNERCWTLLGSTSLTSTATPWLACIVYLYRLDHLINRIGLYPDPGSLRLGDVTALFGPPLASTLCWWTARLPGMPLGLLRARIYFKNNVEVWAYSQQHPLALRYDAEMVVYSINYDLPAQSASFPRLSDWHGFTRLRHRLDC